MIHRLSEREIATAAKERDLASLTLELVARLAESVGIDPDPCPSPTAPPPSNG